MEKTEQTATNECFHSEVGEQMPEGEYVLSWYYTGREPVLVRRPWWNLWGRDKIEMRERQTRKVITGLKEDEATVIRNASRLWHSDVIGRLLIRMMGENPRMVQLEVDLTRRDNEVPT